MNPRYKRINTATALFLVSAVMHVYLGISIAAPKNAPYPPAEPQQMTGILRTQGNKPIAMNGASAISGATVVSGTNIETPERVGATVALGMLGWLDIGPKAILSLTFDRNGSVKVHLSQGCVVLHTRKNTTGQINTVDGLIGKSDPTKDDVLRVCSTRGAVPPADIGGSGAAAGMSTATKATIATLAGAAVVAAVILVPCRRGRNPSPGDPRGRNDECR